MRSQIILCCVLILASSSIAQEHTHASNEQFGTVHFASSCNKAAQGELDRAVALLHSFEFGKAIEGFNAALRSDATCAVAYWGIALSDWSNPFAPGLKDKTQLQAGRAMAEQGARIGANTERERDYVAAVTALYTDFESTPQQTRLVAYRDRMEQLAARYPADHEARIFYALAIAISEDPSDKTYADRLKAGAILEKLFQQEPNHPGLAHYVIHTYDVPPLAARALPASRRYSEIAPDAPHALHMPSHTFTRMGYWQDSIASNLAATAAARRDGETAEELHASDYEVYAYLQTGQDKAAQRLLNSLPEIASRFDPQKVIGGAAGPPVGYFALAAIPARYALERGDWKQASQLNASDTPFPYTQAMTWFARGLGSARMGEAKRAYYAADQLKAVREQLTTSGEKYWALQVQIEETDLRAWAMLAEGRKAEALQTMQSATVLEDGTEKSAMTPGPLAPAHELYGEMLLQVEEPGPALEQFELALKKEPRRLRSLYGAGHAAESAGHHDRSQNYFRDLLKICEYRDKASRAELIEAERAVLQH